MERGGVIATINIKKLYFYQMKANRHNKRKQKQGCGCKMCKPHKGRYTHFFKPKDRSIMKSMLIEN